MATHSDTSRPLRDQYAALAASGGLAGSSASPGYSEDDLKHVPEGAIALGLGCGNPTALAQLQPGQIILDLGSGAGLDAFIAARKVGPTGRVIGIDMTAAMVNKANQYAKDGGYTNVQFKLGRIERLPLPDASIDVIISNCVINHSPDKPAVFRESLRILRPGGLLLISDLVVEGDLPLPGTPGLEIWKQWLQVACGKAEYLSAAHQSGFRRIEIVDERPYTGSAMTESLSGKIISLQLRLQK